MINKIRSFINRRLSKKAYVGLLFVAMLGITLDTSRVRADMVYSNDFESAVGTGWSSTAGTPIISITPNGRRFLGRDGWYGFSNETASLALTGLPAHTQVTVEFDLYVIMSWDGNSGPDIWNLKADATTLLYTTFCNWSGQNQAYPGAYPGGNNPPRTGADESNSLGYTFYGDTVYHLSYSFLHSADSLTLDFTASGLQEITDESWGIDNVAVHIGWSCSGKATTIHGTSGNDVITGTNGPDVINGLGGDDTIDGLGGNDVICAGTGHDIVNGGIGNDKLFGEGGNDVLKGDLGNDALKGGPGDDDLDGGPDNNCDGGTGNDTAVNCGIITNVP